MSDLQTTEGHIPFDAGLGTPVQTYWKKYSSTTSPSPRGPALLIVHGGPTFAHNYLLSLRSLASRGTHSCVIFYDQLGCGNSTKIPEKKNDSTFWTLALLRAELENLVGHFGDIAPEAQGRWDLYGHSCGALLSSFLAAKPPAGLRMVVLSNGMASLGLLHEALEEQLEGYPVEMRERIIEWEQFALGRRAECRVSHEEYMEALVAYRDDRVMRIQGEFPEELLESYKSVQSSRDSFRGFAGGDVQMSYGGSLENEDARPVLPRIAVPTLVLNGEFDKAGPICSAPFHEMIPGARRVVMSGTSHFPFYEDQARYLDIVDEFLKS